jgi:hypothetical protein
LDSLRFKTIQNSRFVGVHAVLCLVQLDFAANVSTLANRIVELQPRTVPITRIVGAAKFVKNPERMADTIHWEGIPMLRREWLIGLVSVSSSALAGCRGHQYGYLMKPDAANMVGSHAAGSEVFDPLVDETVAKLLAREHQGPCPTDINGNALKKTVCFVGVENKMAEDIGDFKDQLYQQIDSQILESDAFRPISRRMVDAALYETRMRPDALMIPENMRLFTAVLERQGAPVDYLLYATLTSGTTQRNSSKQRDYLMTLEMVQVSDGDYQKVSAEIRKGYHKTSLAKVWDYNPLK